MPSRLDRGAELAELLRTAAGVAATHRAAELAGQLPAVLVGPPVIVWTDGAFGGPAVTWTLLAVAATTDPDTAWAQLDELVSGVAGLLDTQRADPTAWPSPTGGDALPAYVISYTEILED